ncbi:class I adenylate-forming enzyme family protein [Paenibacillus woosongensis]|uniref:AMP-binding protein n=1 Tax=Paenibacillus woosongensis TaxID=307580 RepID=A0A7X2Z0M0_9BACL|nr:class I adenylate-forming enzyme family protein [Paenibacillus woosongensis]MUG45288.1 AMP-binding protein [Paenibacillus woosongensis]
MEFVVNGKSVSFDSSKTALTDGKRHLSYRDIYVRINSTVSILEQHGIQSVVISCRNSIDWCIFYLSCFFCDKKVFVLNNQHTSEELIQFCTDYGINAIISDSEVEFNLSISAIEVPDVELCGIHIVNRESLDEQLCDVSTILFTSGTTGKPKGVMLTYENIVTNVLAVTDYISYSSKDTILIVKPLYHSSTLTAELIAGILCGATLFIYSEGFNPLRILQICNQNPITILGAVPTMIASLVRFSAKYKGGLRAVSISGAYLDVKLAVDMHKMFNCDIYHCYGLSEASPRVTYLDPNLFINKAGSIGKPISGVSVILINENGERIESSHTIGELAVQGKNVMKGYYRRPELTSRVLSEGILLTGDLGYRDEDGFFYLRGRKDEMIVRGGLNVWPSSIEDAIRSLYFVKEVAVIGIEDYFYSNKIVAFIVLASHAVSNTDNAKQIIAKACKKHNVISPDQIEFTESIPKSPVGKIQRYKLRELWLQKSQAIR